MRGLAVVLLIPWALLSSGCRTVGQIPDDDFARYIETGAKLSTKYGLQKALAAEPAKAAEITENAKLAVEIVRKNVLPVFQGASSADVLRSAVETALTQLGEKLKPQLALVIQLAIDMLATQVNLPANPADKLDERTTKAVAALFKGAADGVEAAIGGARDIAPPGIRWPKK